MKAWHFLQNSGKLRDGTKPPPDGVWLEYPGIRRICESGLHASIKPLDALGYSPGNIVCRVEVDTFQMITRDYKINVCRRKIIWRYNASEVLHHFACLCALDVIELWPAPEIVRKYLRTRDPELRAEAGDASWAASCDDWASDRASDRASARKAAREAAREAVRDSFWQSAYYSARGAVSWAASGAASWAAFGASVGEAVMNAQNKRLTRMLTEGRP